MSIRLADLAETVGGSVRGDGDRVIEGVDTLEEAGPAELSFLTNPHYLDAATRSRAGAILVPPGFERLEHDLLIADPPYLALANRPGVAVMAGHLLHRDLDPERPASLSPAVIDGLLRRELEYDGVVVTDSIDMRAITQRWTPEQAAVLAVRAGADLVIDGFNLIPDRQHPTVALAQALERAVDEGVLAGEHIARSCERLDRFRVEIGRSA